MADSITIVTPEHAERAVTPGVLTPLATPMAKADDAEPKRLSVKTKLAFATGGSVDIFGHWLFNNMVDPVYNVFLGLTPTQVSITRASSLVADACSGLFFGWLSDNTRSRWGRRRPYILIGSILTGLALPLLFAARPSWSNGEIFLYVLLASLAFAPLIACVNTPYQSLGAELTPDYNERTIVQSYKAFVQKTAAALLGCGLWFATRPMFNDPTTGKPDVAFGAVCAAAICGALMIVSGIINFAFVQERYYDKARNQTKVGFRRMFTDAFSTKPYLVVLGTALVYAVPTGLVNTLGFYALTYHVYGGDMKAGSGVHAIGGFAYMLFGFAGVYCTGRISRAIGKHKTLMAMLGVGLFAFGSSWWLYTPSHPWLSVLCQGLNGFSATGLWVILPAMTADVIDFDELYSGKRREGAFTSAFSWTVKVGMMVSMLFGGPLLQLTGFDAKLPVQSEGAVFGIRLLFAGIPVTALMIALLLIQFYSLDTERMREIRSQLEARRGTV
jgi:GPH family glycoside/pentoside/hexuronide:cation symporter